MLTTLMLVSGLAAEQAAPPPRVQWLLFEMENCVPCQTLKGEIRPKLNKAGWVMSSSNLAQVRTVSREKNPMLVEAYSVEVYPTLILVRDGKIVFRQEGKGKLTALDIARKYNAEMERVVDEDK